MKYLWTEDTGAGLHFWKLVNQLFFDNTFVIESKGSNQGLLDAVSDLEIEDGDKYYIAFDYVVDNQDIRNKYELHPAENYRRRGGGPPRSGVAVLARSLHSLLFRQNEAILPIIQSKTSSCSSKAPLPFPQR